MYRSWGQPVLCAIAGDMIICVEINSFHLSSLSNEGIQQNICHSLPCVWNDWWTATHASSRYNCHNGGCKNELTWACHKAGCGSYIWMTPVCWILKSKISRVTKTTMLVLYDRWPGKWWCQECEKEQYGQKWKNPIEEAKAHWRLLSCCWWWTADLVYKFFLFYWYAIELIQWII